MTVTLPPPASTGMSLTDIDTPALIIDLDAFERNLGRMADMLAGKPVRLRAHSTTHKSPVIALKQMQLGAVGVCCQKVSEAEIMVAGGVKNVLVSNEVIGARKLQRLAALARDAEWLGLCVDSDEGLAQASAEAAAAGATLHALVEIDIGAGRCGIAPGEPALRLAQAIAGAPGLSFAGLQAYHGSAQHIRDHADRRKAIDAATDLTRTTVGLLAENGLECGSCCCCERRCWR